MNDFKSTGKKMTMGHGFPSDFGFTASSGTVSPVKPYTRKAPIRRAEGGSVGHALTQRDQPISVLDEESGGKTPLRPGFKRGGKPIRRAVGGPVRAAKGGALSKAGNLSPKPFTAPKNGGSKGFGSFKAKPLIGQK